MPLMSRPLQLDLQGLKDRAQGTSVKTGQLDSTNGRRNQMSGCIETLDSS